MKEQLQILLDNLAHIDTSSAEGLKKLNQIRAQARILSSDKPAPGMTATVATTYAGVGLCLEMAQRFLLEYVLATKKQNIALIFTNASGIHTAESCVFVFVGDLNVPENLLIGKGLGDVMPASEFISLPDLIARHSGKGIFVDPVLRCVGSSPLELQALMDYSEAHGAMTVCGVRDYSGTIGLVDNAPLVQANAMAVALAIKELDPAVSVRISLTEDNSDYIDRLAHVMNSRKITLIRRMPDLGCAFFNKAWLRQVRDFHEAQTPSLDILSEIQDEVGVTFKL